MRELGSLRNDARTLAPTISDSITAEVEWLIASAAQAVDDTITGPENETLLLGACAAIIEARERIATMRATTSRSDKIVKRSVELRRQSARLLYDSIRSDTGDKLGE
ncbi:MAG TPA: hypothetical protein VFT38_16045 [Vicinamibacteria bacterium]|nr:hypothetical protein [Vicinamibacteria bacterium]